MLRKVSVEIQVLRNGGFLGILRAFQNSPPTIKMDASGSVKGTFSGQFEKTVLDRRKQRVDFDPFHDELQPVLTINGIRYKLGIFVPVNVTPSYDDVSNKESISIEAYDRSWYVQTTTGKSRIYFQRGTRYLDAVKQLLAASGIALIDSTDCDATMIEDREDWDLGTDYLTVVNALLREINFKELWFDSTGTAILEPITTPTVAQIRHKLDSRDPLTLVRPGLTRKSDFYETPNIFICVCDNPEKTVTMTAVAKNTNQYSPLSIQRRGREIIKLEIVDNISSQEALQKYADQLLFNSMISGEVIDVKTSLLPGWGIGDVVSLHYNDVHVLCVSQSWSMQLKVGGTMSHSLKKIVYNLDTGENEEGV